MKRMFVSLFLCAVILLPSFSCYAAENGSTLKQTGLPTLQQNSIEVKSVPAAPELEVTASKDYRSVVLTWKERTEGVTGFIIERRDISKTFTVLTSVKGDVSEYNDTSVKVNTTYSYRIKAVKNSLESGYSNTGDIILNWITATPAKDPTIPKPPVSNETDGTGSLPLSAPSSLKASPASPYSSDISLKWIDNNKDVQGYKVEQNSGIGVWKQIGQITGNKTNYRVTGLKYNVQYQFRVKAYNLNNDSPYSNIAEITPVEAQQKVVCFYEGSKLYTVNGEKKEMDVVPVNVNGRLMIPVRYLAEPLGANLSWTQTESKVTAVLYSNVVEMWVNNNMASINGTMTMIDPNDSSITPIIISNRSFVPLRFLADSLGCSVAWEPHEKKVTITYPVSGTPDTSANNIE